MRRRSGLSANNANNLWPNAGLDYLSRGRSLYMIVADFVTHVKYTIFGNKWAEDRELWENFPHGTVVLRSLLSKS